MTSIAKNEKFDSINMIRGIAILMVMLVHTAQQIDGGLLRNFSLYGMMGVQLFFMASAFTLCLSMNRRKTKENLTYFYMRRYFRIAPGYYLGIAVYFTVFILCKAMNVPNLTGEDYTALNIAVNLFFLNGLYAPANNNIVPGGWSIGVEMLFYLIFPFIFMAYQRMKNRTISLIIYPILALIFSLVFQSLFVTRNPELQQFYYYNILNQLPVFLVGMSLFFAYQKGILNHISKMKSILSFFLFSVLSGAMLFIGSDLFLFFDVLIPFTSALSFVFVFIYLQFHFPYKPQSLMKMGIYSYSSYLMHFIYAVYLTRFLSERLSFIPPDIRLVILYTLTVVLTYITASIVYRFVEQPGAKLGKKVIDIFQSVRQKDIKVDSHY